MRHLRARRRPSAASGPHDRGAARPPTPSPTQPPGSGSRTASSPVATVGVGVRRCAPWMHRPAARPGATRPARPGRAPTVVCSSGAPARSIRVVPVQRPGSSPVRPSSTCSVGRQRRAARPRSTTSSARWCAPAATTVGSSARSSVPATVAVIRCDRRARSPPRRGQRHRGGHRPHAEPARPPRRPGTPPRRPRRADRTPSRPGARVVGPVRRTASCPLARTTGSTVRPPGPGRATTSTLVLTPTAAPAPAPARAPTRPPSRGRRVLAQRDQQRRLARRGRRPSPGA